jgi:hypothetical protein
MGACFDLSSGFRARDMKVANEKERHESKQVADAPP